MSDRAEIVDLFAAFELVTERLDHSGFRISKPVSFTTPLAAPVGSCSACHRRDPAPGRRCCVECVRRITAYNAGAGRLKHRVHANGWKARMRAAASALNVCTMCLKRAARPDRTNCKTCAGQQAERYRRSRAR